MSSETSKFLQEEAAFSGFARLRGLQLIEGSLRKGAAELREPDILCEIKGEGPIAYEITKATSPELEREIKQVLEDGEPIAKWFDDSIVATLHSKLKKKYACTCPVELIVCKSLCAVPHRFIREILEGALGSIGDRGPFRTIWLLADGEVSEIRGFEIYRADREAWRQRSAR